MSSEVVQLVLSILRNLSGSKNWFTWNCVINWSESLAIWVLVVVTVYFWFGVFSVNNTEVNIVITSLKSVVLWPHKLLHTPYKDGESFCEAQ